MNLHDSTFSPQLPNLGWWPSHPVFPLPLKPLMEEFSLPTVPAELNVCYQHGFLLFHGWLHFYLFMSTYLYFWRQGEALCIMKLA